jgi:hypothetical protein
MQVSQVEKTIHEFLNTMDESIRDSGKVSKFFSTLDDAGLKIMEEASKQSMQELLFVLLNFVSVGSETAALAACDRILLFLKNIPVMFDSFNPNREVLKKLNLKRLLGAKQSQIVYDLMIFILRYYSDVDYDDYDLGPKYQEALVKEEKKRVWLILDHILIKQNTFLEDFRTRNATTAKALGEILSYISDLKKSINESKSQNRSSMNHEQPHNQSAISAEDISKLAEKREVEQLKREVEGLKESLMKSAVAGAKQSAAPAVNKKDERGVDRGLTEPPKAYLMDGVTNELTTLKSRFNSLLLEMEDLKKVTHKLTDDKSNKIALLERKVEEDLESFRLFKERVQIEVGSLKDRNAVMKNSAMVPGNSSVMDPHTTPGRAGQYNDEEAHSKLETLTKIQENFRKDTILNLNKLNTAMTILGKKLGLSGLNMNSPNFDPNEIKEADNATSPGGPTKLSTPEVAGSQKQGSGTENGKKDKDKQFAMLDDDRSTKLESRMYEQELAIKRMVFDHKKELMERIDILANTIDDFKNRQSGGLKQEQKGVSSAKGSSDPTYDSYVQNDQKKEIDEYLKQLRRETENRFANDQKDILYLSEKFKYLESVRLNLIIGYQRTENGKREQRQNLSDAAGKRRRLG